MSTLDAICTAVVTYGASHLADRRVDFGHVAGLCTEIVLDGPASFDGSAAGLGAVFDALAKGGVRRPWLAVDGGRAAVALAGDVSGMWTAALDPIDDGGRGLSFRARFAWREVPGFVPERPSLGDAHATLHEAFEVAAALPAGADALWAAQLRSALAGEAPQLYRNVVPAGYPDAARDVAHAAMWALDVASRLLGRASEAEPARHRTVARELRVAMLRGLVAAANTDL